MSDDLNEQELAERLRSEDVEQRRSVVRFLEGLPLLEGPHRRALFALLGDDDWRVRRDALDVAVALADEGFVDAVIEGVLQGERVGLRNACIELGRTMGALYGQAIAKRLNAGLDPSPLLFDGVARGDVDFLAGYAEGEDVNVSAAAVAALARVGGQAAQSRLMALLDSSDRFRVLAALDGLRELGARVPFERLSALLEDRIVWRSVVPLLGDTEDPRAAAALARGLASPSTLAKEAALGLERLDRHVGADVVPAVLGEGERRTLRALTGRDEAGTAALVLLVRARDGEATEELLEAVAERRLPPRAVASLRVWGEGAVRIVLRAGRTHRAVALELAAELSAGDDAAREGVREALEGALEDPDAELQLAGLRGLALAGDARSLTPIMRKALGGGPEGLARQAALTLSSLAHRHRDEVADSLRGVRLDAGTAELATVLAEVLGADAKGALLPALSSDDVALRSASASALEGVEGDDVTRKLAFALSDEHFAVRIATAAALGRRGGNTATEALRARLLVEDDARVASVIREALGDS